MAEKSTLVEKLPPLAKAESPAPQPAPKPAAPVSNAKPTAPTTTVAKTTPKPTEQVAPSKAETKEEVVVATTQEPAGPTSTMMQQVTYYSFLGDALIWGLIGVCLFGKAFKDKKKVNFVATATYGGLLVLMGLVFFIESKAYASFLYGSVDEPALTLRAFGWMVSAPALFYAISCMIRVPSEDKKLYLTMFGLASSMFLFMGVAQLLGGRLEKIGVSIFPILFMASLAYLMFLTLGKGAGAIRGKNKQGIQIVTYAIIGGWSIYALVNLLSIFSASHTGYSLTLNIVDFAMFSSITYGLWSGMANSDRIAFLSSFGRRGKASASFPASSPASSDDLEVDRDKPNKPKSKPKPNFKAPADVSKN